MERLLPRWLNPFASNRARQEGFVGGLRAELAGLRDTVRERDRAIQERDARIVDRERHISELDLLMKEREAAVRERETLLRERDAQIAAGSAGRRERVIPLGRDSLLVRLDFGGHIVVPTWNMDVAVSIVRDGVIEPWTQSAVKALLRPGQTFLNVGANLGYYMVLGAHCVERKGQVIAVEANRRLFPYLLRTVSWAGFPDIIRLFNCAAGDVDGLSLETRFDPQYVGGMSVIEAIRRPNLTERDETWSKTLDSERLEDAIWDTADLSPLFDANGEWRNAFSLHLTGRCETRRLDTILPSTGNVHLMLLDIEGSEPSAILGAEELIRRSPELNIIMEWSPFYSLRPDNIEQTDAMYGFLNGLGLKFFRIRHEDFTRGKDLPSLTPLANKSELYSTPHNDILISKDPDAFVEGWSGRFVGLA